jgi:NitT/TauT family transport system substrate-binding protein
MPMTYTRRRFLQSLAAAGVVGLGGAPHAVAATEELETTTVRLVNDTSICIAPEYVAEEFLRAEGFTDIRYIEAPGYTQYDALMQGKVDFCNFLAPDSIPQIEAGAPIVVLAGIHIGCIEFFAREGIRSVADLKGKIVGLRSTPPGLLKLMAASVGLDPKKDISWVTGADSKGDPLELFAQGQIDGFLGFPPEPQELRARRVGHVILNMATDRPWSQYFCCMLLSSREFVRRHPVATKRVLRAILKAADLCVAEPARVARRIVEGGFTQRYDYASQTLSDIPFDKWREYDAEDTIRFYALRMREAGTIKSSPQKIITDGTDWRFLNELKRELKA